MNRVLKIMLGIIIATCFTYCKKPTEFKEIEINNLFWLQIPAYFHPTDDLLPVTGSNIQQYDDNAGKIFLMIFDTSRINVEISSLKVFYDSMVVDPVMDSIRILEPKLVKVDNDSTYQSEITGKRNGVRLFGEMEAIASKNCFYFIITWSDINRRKELKPDMYKMLNSFHEVSYLKK